MTAFAIILFACAGIIAVCSILDSLHRAGRLPFDDPPTTLEAELGYFRRPLRKYKPTSEFAIDHDNVAKAPSSPLSFRRSRPIVSARSKTAPADRDVHP